jgi:glycosyltransferase involved in cell wall biosynthesis
MHVLMLSLDPSLLTDPNGNARARHLDYAARCGRLTIIVRRARTSGAPVHASDALTLIPSASRHPILYPWDALRIGRDLSGIDLIVTQDQFTSGLAGVWLRRRLRVPLLVQNHTTLFGNPAWLREKPLRNRALLALASYVRARADFVRTVNQRERAAAIAAGVPEARVAALPLGVLNAAFATPPDAAAVIALRTKLGLLPEHRVILWVGYPVAFKRVPLLLHVFKHITDANPDVRLLLVGDLSPSPDDLRAHIARLGIGECVITPGDVAHHDLPAYYALADVYAHSSSYEGVPRVLMEAASLGVPVVAMRAPGVDEVIEDGVNGCLVADGDVEAMAMEIIHILSDPTHARERAAAGRASALEKYGTETYAERWVGLWQQATAMGMRV